jgi:hypothetical protein
MRKFAATSWVLMVPPRSPRLVDASISPALQKSSEWPSSRHGAAGISASDIRSADPDLKILRLEAQDTAIPFYEKMGFAVVGSGFLQAGIPHHAMESGA